ncbi:hypothetical protein [Streptomyces longwoodensis]|uniref:hypothetical protein n=1 Tax=Streptomyces longwoodensis TaxID=68231 RepID=UPI0033FCAD91
MMRAAGRRFGDLLLRFDGQFIAVRTGQIEDGRFSGHQAIENGEGIGDLTGCLDSGPGAPAAWAYSIREYAPPVTFPSTFTVMGAPVGPRNCRPCPAAITVGSLMPPPLPRTAATIVTLYGQGRMPYRLSRTPCRTAARGRAGRYRALRCRR